MDKYKTALDRILALIIDVVVVGIILGPLNFIYNNLWQTEVSTWVELLWTAFIIIFFITYFVYMHFKFGQTIGKWSCGIMVLDCKTENRITLKQSLCRSILFAIILFTPANIINLIFMLGSDQRKTFHDLSAGTVVIKIQSSKEEEKSEASHPLSVITVVVTSFFGIGGKMIAQSFEKLFQGFGEELPWLTQIFVGSPIYYALIILGLASYASRLLRMGVSKILVVICLVICFFVMPPLMITAMYLPIFMFGSVN